jgi:hypothetical protein
MFALMSPRLWAAVFLALFLAGTHWKAYTSGRKAVQLQWDAATAQATAAALDQERQARAKEQELANRNRRIANELVAEQARRAAADRAAADSLQRLRAALAEPASPAGTDPAPAAGADGDPRDGIIAECAGAVVRLDAAARGLAGTLGALQGYAREVCVSGR